MRVKTFDLSAEGEAQVEGELLPGTPGQPLRKIKLDDGRTVARHRDRITPITDAARAALGL